MKNTFLHSNVAHLIATNGLSQKELAQKMGWSNSAVSNLVNGKSELDIDRIIALADYFDISLDDLLKKDLSAQGYSLPLTADILAEPEQRMLQLVELFGKKIDDLQSENVKLKNMCDLLLERFPEQIRILKEEFGEDFLD